jgi:hypothetical protein
MDWARRLSGFRDEVLALPMPARAVFITSMAVALLAVLLLMTRLVAWWVESSVETARLEPRIAQIIGYLESEQKIDSALNAYGQMLDELAFPGSGDSGMGGALLQQELRQLSSESGLVVVGTEVRQPDNQGALLRLGVNVRVAGPPESVIGFLESLQQYRPLLFVSSLSLSAQRRQRRAVEPSQDNLMLQLDVHAYQLGENR